MSFGENLQFYRKRNNITQEQLAESLNVSRQSVSKWESDASFPEMDKLLQMCDMFSCNLDTLTRGDAVQSSAVDTANYDAHMSSRAKWIAIGVWMILLGCSVVSFLEGFGVMEELADASFLIFVAIAVVMFIVKGIQHENFKKRFPNIQQFYGQEEIYRFEKKFPLLIAAPVAAIILNVACNDMLETVFESKGLSDCFSDGVFLFVLSFAVGVLVYAALQKAKYDIKEYNAENVPSKEQNKIAKWCGVIMLTATALFMLSIGIEAFGWADGVHDWRNSIMSFSWVVFPIGGIICGIVALILSKDKAEDIVEEDSKEG